MGRKFIAEMVGTLWLVLGGCGSAVIAAAFPEVGIGLLGVSFAFGLTVMTMAYTVGHVSGCHLNPAVTLGLTVAGKASWSDFFPYVSAQIVGGILGAFILLLIAQGVDTFDVTAGFATNGFGDRSPGGYSMMACLITEIVMTFFFLVIIIGSTAKSAPAGFAPIPIGLGLTLIHLVSIPVTNTSVNPARSLGPAIFEGGAAMGQVWLFFVGPLVGAALAGVFSKFLQHD